MSRRKNFWLAFSVALVFCVVLWVGFIPSVLAKDDSDWSPDYMAYAYVEGTPVGNHVTDEYHYGMVTDDPMVGSYDTPYTRFEGGTEYNDRHDLQLGQFYEDEYDETVLVAITETYSGASSNTPACTAEALITGFGP